MRIKYFIRKVFNYHWILHSLLPDSFFIQRNFKKSFGYKLNLANPQTLNEKIQWLKLNDRTPLHTLCADKYNVRKFISDTIGKEFLVPLLFQTYQPNNLIPENVPNLPLIIKANHNSGGTIIVYNKNEIDWSKIRKKCETWLNENHYHYTKEWQYKNIRPCIIIEKLLLDSNGNVPADYKLHCINGKVEMISVDQNRGTSKHSRNWYLPDWQRAPFKWSSYYNNRYTDPLYVDIPKPLVLETLIELSHKIAKYFRYVRIDFYVTNDQIYFGEITFHHDGGYRPIEPSEWDKKLGKKLQL